MSDLKLGSLITAEQHRDAIHVAVAPVKAFDALTPGQRIYVEGNEAHPEVRDNAIGIVDPFLNTNVERGEMFWLFLFPGTITALRHDWAHPSFPTVDTQTELQRQTDLARMLLNTIAKRISCDYLELMFRLDLYAEGSCGDDDAIQEGLNNLEDEVLVGQMWDAYEQIRGVKLSSKLKSQTYFNCAC